MIETDQVDVAVIVRAEIAFLTKIQMESGRAKNRCAAGLPVSQNPSTHICHCQASRNIAVSNTISSLRLRDAWHECERNTYYLCGALTLLDPVLPMTGKRFEQLTDAQVQSLDQFILRFTKL
ncbi:MAG: hypothetical protein ACXWJK_11370 [Burkholderiaceae bacterium]